MPAVTFKQAVNRVLVKLREDEVTALSSASSYEKLIAAFINEAKEEVEDAWKWNSLQDTITVTTVADTSTYALAGVGQEFSIEGAFNSTNNVWMRGPMPNWRISQWNDISGSTGTPLWWDIYGVDSSNDPNFRLWPIPSAVFSIAVYTRHRQAYLDTATDDDTVIKVPWKPVVFKAYSKAISERGEDGGLIYDETLRDFEGSLSDAIALDVPLGHVSVDWTNEELHRTNQGSPYIGLP